MPIHASNYTRLQYSHTSVAANICRHICTVCRHRRLAQNKKNTFMFIFSCRIRLDILLGTNFVGGAFEDLSTSAKTYPVATNHPYL